jgi:hypothetical protein
MKSAIPRLRKKLGADSEYFRRVYTYTFEFARSEGQRSLGIDIALAFWGLLLPHGLKGGALRPQDYGGDDPMKPDGGWTEEHTQLWYDFLNEKNIKGISKDTWAMARSFFLFFFFWSPQPVYGAGKADAAKRVHFDSSLLSCARPMQSLRRTTWKVGPFPHLFCSTVRALRPVNTLMSPCSRMAVDDR